MDHFDHTASLSRMRRFASAAAALTTLTLLAGCDSGSPDPTPAGNSPSTPASPTATVAPSPIITPVETPTPAPLGWPRDGWTIHSLQPEGMGGIAVYHPDTWTFDTNESGLWWDGTYHVFCDPYIDHSLNDPDAPDPETLATTQWSLMGATVTNQHAITTYYGYDGWGGDYELPLLPGTVEHRAFVIIGDVWVHCGAITRNTDASGDELWDIVDSIQVVPPQSDIQERAWNAGI